MKPFSVKTREIYINQSEKSLCDTFVYEPSNVEERKLGNLYITGQLYLEEDVQKDETLSYLVNLLASVIKREYYFNSKREPLKSLEQALKKANITLNDFAEKGNTDWMGNLHFITGSLVGSTLHVAQSGKVRSVLLRGEALTDIGQIIPVLGTEIHSFKTFTSIASGTLKEGDLIIFSTPELFEIINTDKLKMLSLESSTEEIGQKIQGILTQNLNDKKINLGVIILKIESQERITPSPIRHKDEFYQAEIKQVQEPPKEKEKEEEREKLLLPATKYLLKYLLKGAKFLKVVLLWGLQKLLILVAINSLKALKSFSSFIKSVPAKLYNILKPTLWVVTRRMKKATFALSSGREKIKRAPFKDIVKQSLVRHRPPIKIRLFPSSSKILLAVSILLAILLGTSLGIIYKKRVFEFKVKQYRELLDEAYLKEDQAEAAIIYQDLKKARVSLREARELAASVFSGTDYLKKECLRLLTRIENQGDALDQVVHLAEPKLIFNFEDLKFSPQQIIGSGKELYIIDSQNSFYRLDLKNPENPSKINVNFSNIGHLKRGVALENLIVFYTDTPGIAIFEKDKNTIKSADTSIWQPPLSQEVKDIASYHRNIYLLDSRRNQILKSYKTLTGFSNPRPWLKEEANLGEVSSLAIDGAIYILKETGEILKYLHGKKIEFRNPEFLNPLKKTTKIFTTPTFRNLYIIDQRAKKLVILDKKGNLVKQYFSEKFDNLKDMFVSSNESRIFLLSGVKIYQIDIEL